MAMHYYYLVAGLPDLHFDEGKPCPDFKEFIDDIKSQVEPADARMLSLFQLPYDNRNLIRLVENKEWDFEPQGNFSEEALQIAVKTHESLPEYMITFMEAQLPP